MIRTLTTVLGRQFLPRKCEYIYRTRVGQGKGKWVRVCVLKIAFPALNLGPRPVPSGVTREDVAAVRRRWNAAVGVPIVARKDWHRWSASDKRRLVHDVARNAQGQMVCGGVIRTVENGIAFGNFRTIF